MVHLQPSSGAVLYDKIEQEDVCPHAVHEPLVEPIDEEILDFVVLAGVSREVHEVLARGRAISGQRSRLSRKLVHVAVSPQIEHGLSREGSPPYRGRVQVGHGASQSPDL